MTWLVPIIVLGAIGATGTEIVRDAWWDSCDSAFIAGEINSAHGYEGTDEYQPIGADRSDLVQSRDAEAPSRRIEMVNSSSGEIIPATRVRLHIERWSAEQKVFTAETADRVKLALQILNYPAWGAMVDGQPAQIEAAPDTAQMFLTLPPGAHRVEIRFRRTSDRTAGDAISSLSAIGLLGFAFFRARRHPRQPAE